MLLSTDSIFPSQDFLKPGTIKFIFDCLKNGNVDQLPPPPYVRLLASGKFVAIDGHNLIAVREFRHEPVDVIIAESSQQVLPETSDANRERNAELSAKFESVLVEQKRVGATGVNSFQDLIAKYPELFI